MAPNNRLKYVIRAGRTSDLAAYLKACQLSAVEAYGANPIYRSLFSKEHYFHPGMMPYWEETAANDSQNRWWVADLQQPKAGVIGGICLRIGSDFCEGRGFYVHPDWQKNGIGQALWDIRSKEISKPMFFEVYSHADRTLKYHLKRGARLTGRQRPVHWDSWPEDITLTALELVHER